MTDEARVLLNELLRQHENVCRELGPIASADVTASMINRGVITYGTFCERAGVPFLTHSVGKFLGEVAEFCNDEGWPPINALAVNSETRMPGEGYDGASGCTIALWPEEVRKCIAFGGYPTSTAK